MPQTRFTGFLDMKYFIAIYQWLVGGSLFFLFLVLSFLMNFIFPHRVMDPFVKWMLRNILRLIFIRVKTEGTEHLQKGKSYLYLPNHVSFLDIPLFGGFLPGFLRGLEADRQHKWPVYGWAMKRLGNITIDRSSARSSMTSLNKAAEYLNDNCSILLFPEGGRTSDGQLRPFKKLPFLMAKQAKAEIVPVAMIGMFEINNKNSMWVHPGTITLVFGEPISAETIETLDVVELRDHVKTQLVTMLADSN